MAIEMPQPLASYARELIEQRPTVRKLAVPGSEPRRAITESSLVDRCSALESEQRSIESLADLAAQMPPPWWRTSWESVPTRRICGPASPGDRGAIVSRFGPVMTTTVQGRTACRGPAAGEPVQGEAALPPPVQ
jgi:hypothetical protein